ncbi:amino acid ABC transporter ATP-binding/permease protein [Enterococcus sp. UD-01]|uniref:amino acid ABC transporter ATP-binding/permease protein n=1 Tax=Enterococcus sp. UD-01 TaxID=3373911 RepID=UPI0038383126
MREAKVIRWLLTFVSHVKLKVILAVCLGIISNLAVVAIPIIGLQTGLELYYGQASAPGQALLWMLMLGVIRGVARYGEQYLNHEIAFHLLADIREYIFAAVRALGPAKLAGKKSGDLVTAITTDVEALEVFFAHTISPVLIALGTSIATISYLWQYHAGLAVVLLVGQLLVGVVIPLKGYYSSRRVGDDFQEAFVVLNQKVIENIAGLQDIAQYSLAQEQLSQLGQAGQALNKQYKRRLEQESKLKIWSEIILLLTAVSIFLLGVQLGLAAETVLISTVLSLSAFGSVLALSGLGSALLTTLASAKRLFLLTNEQPVVTFAESHEMVDTFETGKAQDVTFAYNEQPLLEALSITVEKGKIIGIGGQSGNGKSTLVKLFMRYWDPKAGTFTIDQTNLKELTEASIHRIEGVMEQSTFLFEDTISNNIKLGKPAATQAEVVEAAKKASLHEWIQSLPDGYETMLDSSSRNVSDGERQRLGLARLFLHDAPFLLLDEPTSNLDYLNEQIILSSLTKETAAKAVLLISHRDTTLAIAQQRYLLEKGRLHAGN